MRGHLLSDKGRNASFPGIVGGRGLDPIRRAKTALGFDDHLERLPTGRFSERVVGFQNAVKREMVSNQKLGLIFRDWTVLSSMDVLKVSTNRVVMVMLCDQRR